MHLVVCNGCGELFETDKAQQKFCINGCRLAHFRVNKRRLFLPPAQIPIALPPSACQFREAMRRSKPSWAVGYRLIHPALELIFPLPGKTKRFRGSMSNKPYFELKPFVEAPRVPIHGYYLLYWVWGSGEVTQALDKAKVSQLVLIDFPQDMSGYPDVAKALATAKKAGFVTEDNKENKQALLKAGLINLNSEEPAKPGKVGEADDPNSLDGDAPLDESDE